MLVCHDGDLRIVEGNRIIRTLTARTVTLGAAPRKGVARSDVAATFLDGRWLRDGRIAALDIFGTPLQFTMHGEPYGDPEMPPNPWHVELAVMSEGGVVYGELESERFTIHGLHERRRWELHQHTRWHGLGNAIVLIAELAHDGRRLAIGYEWRVRQGEPWKRGWIALDVSIAPKPSGRWQAAMLARGDGDVTALAFDQTNRLLVATNSGAGVVRLDGEAVELEAGDGPRCAAFDARGMRAVYGYRHPTLRIDYLDRKRSGPPRVDVAEQHRIDAGFAPIALALDLEGTRIACLAEDGRVEIVPVP